MVAGALALLSSLVICAALIRLGPRLGFVDRPDGFLKPHELPAVPLGGIGIFVAVHWGMFAAGNFDIGLFLASLIVFALGLVDDRVGLRPAIRLGVEIIAGVVLALGVTTPSLPGGVRSIVLSVLLVVVAVNAVNLFDGLDGLSGSAAFVSALGFATLAVSRGLDGGFGIILGAAIVGFLVWNWHPARLFLGDNGAYTIGVFLVYGALVSAPRAAELEIIIGAGLIGVFAVDLAVTLIRRALAGEEMFGGDRTHVYDQLVDRGFSIPDVALMAAVTQFVIGGYIIVFDRLTAPVSTLLAMVALLVVIVVALERMGFIRAASSDHGT